MREFNGEEIDRESFMSKLRDRLSTAEMNQVKSDVLPFVRNTRELELWSNDFFLQVAGMMKFL